MEGKENKSEARNREKPVVFDPDNLPYSKQHLCVYLRELQEEAEKREDPGPIKGKPGA